MNDQQIRKQRKEEQASQIGARIRTWRQENGLSQAQLGEQVGLVQQAIARAESGKSMPHLPRLSAIAQVLGHSLNELIEGETKPTSRSPRPAGERRLGKLEQELLSYFQMIPDLQGKRLVLQVAKRIHSAAHPEDTAHQAR